MDRLEIVIQVRVVIQGPMGVISYLPRGLQNVALIKTFSESPQDFHADYESVRSTDFMGCPLGRALKLAYRFAKERGKVKSSFKLHDCDLSHEAERSGGF